MKTVRLVAFVVLFLAGGVRAAMADFTLHSSAFKAGATIPHAYSYNGYGCTGKNISPDLMWSGAPDGTRSFAVTVFDPDARSGQGWWHWVVFDLPASVDRLAQNAGAGTGDLIPKGAVQGRNDFQTVGYGGPCPPVGDTPHHYIFTIYSLDVDQLEAVSPLTSGPTLLNVMREHVLAKTELIGRFGR
jgi:Raf kinase inhibitor-like YbhB/YbcL family protein